MTDENLKKTSGMQLRTGQQDTVSQTRQFMEQSKAAMAQGDFERARTLAWKAQLLSEDSAKPEKYIDAEQELISPSPERYLPW